ncbi:hypothetical protein S2M10_39430 [Sphingomonas sp. S2M10]|uniref:hypothetical protein n=1 Tax=Sphingomonas sp. S2M10 TaxID=2705010 RepID=UPI00145693A3|nr:hypothetical protein [Sphingomonas sp. S2M10]NLS28930.1 hypothetical protein [Sphingomonas sp. S2M10]
MSIRTKIEAHVLKRLLALVTADARPNLNALNDIVKEVRILELNVKTLGYALAHRMAVALPPREDGQARLIGLGSKPCTQADIESDWMAHWAAELKTAVIYHRKLWECAYVLQVLFEHGHLVPGARGLGFGCGAEPIPSYLASLGITVTASDDAGDAAAAAGWIASQQHLGSAASPFLPHLVDRERFDRFVTVATVDMNAVPADLQGYDFCWSMCALEHLGSIEAGLRFIERSLETLRPGGTAVHTLELNIDDDGPTVDNWITVLFQRKHLEAFAAKMAAAGHQVMPLSFDFGGQVMDRFIDLPPWLHDLPDAERHRLGPPAHLKLSIDGFVCTSFGIVITKHP